MSLCLLMAKWPKTEGERQGVRQFLRHLADNALGGIRLYAAALPALPASDASACCVCRYMRSVSSFYRGLEGMGLERRAAIAEHRCPITTPARSRS